MSSRACVLHDLVAPKRSWAVVPVGFDWHDFLAQTWGPGRLFPEGAAIRLRRSMSKGLQYRCTKEGTTGHREPNWPITAGTTIVDGSAEWTSEVANADSLRTTIVESTWPSVDGVTLAGAHDNDLRHVIQAGGGNSGSCYEIRQRISCANGEQEEGVAILPVQD